MRTPTDARSRFSAGNIEGASGPRIIVMCFDRLERDLTNAIAAIERHDHYEANSTLGHAQDLIGELATMLDTSAWEHAGSLLAIYDYLLRRLAVANLKKDVVMVKEAKQHVGVIGAAFRTAEQGAAASPAAITDPSRTSIPTSTPTSTPNSTPNSTSGVTRTEARPPSDAAAAPRRLSVQA